MKLWFKKLFCKHEYVHQYSQMIHFGMGKMNIEKCVKCVKERAKIA